MTVGPAAPGGTTDGGPLRTVLVVGTGLIGTSIGLALGRAGVQVHLRDTDAHALATAAARGAGLAGAEADPQLVVLAVPPSAVPAEAARQLECYPAAVVTDVSSAQARVRREAAAFGCDLTRFVGGHPVAGRERSGPEAAVADLFHGRAWVVVDEPGSAPARARVVELAELAGARPVLMTAEAHDTAVALVSHAPHVVAAAMAGPLVDADETTLSLAARGIADTVRIAGAPTDLWMDILAANPGAVADVVDAVRDRLASAGAALRRLAAGDEAALIELELFLRAGAAGHARLPGG